MSKSRAKPGTLTFKVTGDVRVRADLQQSRVVISFVSEDGKVINLESGYQTLERIHQEVTKQLAI
ncbi:MAG: hypothetical protein ISP45_31405 [Reyranella sp.]|nr:hypothetical protein [Reyranella sp.]